MKQQIFHQLMKLAEKEFGGSLQNGHAREQRPISTKKAMHLVLRSTLAKKEKSFLNQDISKKIKNIIYKQAKEKGIKIYQYANSGNHLHLLILASSRKAFHRFIRAISGLIARLTLNINKNSPQKIKFFDAIPYTKIIEWGREYANAVNYVVQNTLEALGFIEYKARKRKTSSA